LPPRIQRAYNPVMLVRYDIRPDPNGWTIFDRTSDLTAEVETFEQVGLPRDDAEEIADLLNTLDVLRRATPQH
jgi:hypothetical protein